MTDDPKRKPIGSITDYQTLGRRKHSDIQQSGSPDIQTSGLPDTQQSTSAGVQTANTPDSRKSKHPEWKQQTIYLPPALAKWLKVHSAQAELEISEIVALALKDYQERHP